MKLNADRSQQAKNSTLQIGDMVLLRQKKISKLTTKFDPHPFKIIRIKGTMITARRNEKYITRNASLFKPVKVDSVEQAKIDENGDEDDLSSESNGNQIDHNPNFPQNNANQTRRYPMRERRPLQRYIEHY